MSYIFEGSSDYLTYNALLDSDFAFGAGDFTIGFWTKLNSIVQQGFVGLDSTSVGVEILMTDATNIRVFVAGSAFNFTITTLVVGTWYYILVVRSGTNLNVYRNSVQEGGTSTSSGLVLNTLGAWIGSRTDPSSETLNGSLEEVSIWKGAALNQNEINQLYTSKVKGISLQVRPQSLVLYLPLNEFPNGSTITGIGAARDRSKFPKNFDQNGTITASANSLSSYQ